MMHNSLPKTSLRRSLPYMWFQYSHAYEVQLLTSPSPQEGEALGFLFPRQATYVSARFIATFQLDLAVRV